MPQFSFLLAKPYEPDKHDIIDWWASEKLDGMRAWWDGKDFWSRNGNLIHAPAWFKASMPTNMMFDGELYMGRGRFQETMSVVRTLVPDERWRKVKYYVFDAPDLGEPEVFETRLAHLMIRIRRQSCPWLEYIPQIPVKSHEHLMEMAENNWALGGEGLMLRKPKSLYEGKRSSTLLKVKNINDDVALVIGHEPGKGKHEGRLGALVCAWKGRLFNIGTGFTDKQRETPPEINSAVKFAFTELTDEGYPRFPRFLCEEKGD